MSESFRVHFRCGCGHGAYLKTLERPCECANCGWPIVYHIEGGGLALSRHADFRFLPRPADSKGNGEG